MPTRRASLPLRRRWSCCSRCSASSGAARRARRRLSPRLRSTRPRRIRPAAEHAEAAHGSEHAVRDMIAQAVQFRHPRRRARLLPEGADRRLSGRARARRSARIWSRPPRCARRRPRSSPRSSTKLEALPAELDALQAQGAEDVAAEQARIAQAAAVERERLHRADPPRDRHAAADGAARADRARRAARGDGRRRSASTGPSPPRISCGSSTATRRS